MTDHREIPEPGEAVYTPRPSWAPVFFAFGVTLAVCGIFAEGFMVRGWVYSIIGGIVALAAFRGMIQGARRDYYRLPLKQKARGAVLPVEQIKFPPA